MKTCITAAAIFLGTLPGLLRADEPTPRTTDATEPPAQTQPAIADGVGTSTTQPAAAGGDFPTPAELMRRIRQAADVEAKKSKVVHFDLSSPVSEKPADFSLFGDPTRTTLRSVLERMRLAREDKDVRAVLITLGETGLNLSQAQEIRDSLVQLRNAGKKTFVYADSYDTASYTLASGATDVCLLEGGEIMIPGVGLETTFAKGLLDKLGVKADYVQVGEYKGADEQFTRTGPSEQMRGELDRLVEALYGQIVEGIAHNRNLSSDVVRQMIDETVLTAAVAKERGFVDHLVHMDQLRDLIKGDLGNDVSLVTNFGQPQQAAPDFSSPFALFSFLAKRPEPSAKPAVALIYAQGTIVDGEAEGGLLGGDGGVGSDAMRKALRRAANDDAVKAIVLRIDSPGGSALASEVMWQAARAVAAKKPLVISIGSMAASGGYYLASAGDQIYADPTAIVGSIGVVGGKFVTKDLFDKLGIGTAPFRRGRNAGLFSSNQPFDERQRRMVTNWMKQTYEQFTRRVMTTRKGKIKDIDQVARGRIFMAKQARELGMVDEIGGIEAALADAAGRAKLAPGAFDVRVLPQPRTLADLFGGGGGADPVEPQAAANLAAALRPTVQVGETSLLRALDASTRRSLTQHLDMLRLLQDRPVVLVSPFTVTVR